MGQSGSSGAQGNGLDFEALTAASAGREAQLMSLLEGLEAPSVDVSGIADRVERQGNKADRQLRRRLRRIDRTISNTREQLNAGIDQAKLDEQASLQGKFGITDTMRSFPRAGAPTGSGVAVPIVTQASAILAQRQHDSQESNRPRVTSASAAGPRRQHQAADLLLG